MSKITAEQMPLWKEISGKPYAGQCKWMLNGFWGLLDKDAELVWTWCHTFAQLDPKKADGCDLDEFWSHKFLETLGETMTVVEMRDKFRKIDADFNKRMSIVEYLSYRYNIKVQDVITAPQGENKEAVEKAQAMVAAAQTAVDQMTTRLTESKQATATAKAAAETAKKAAEAAWFAAQENKKALDELAAQEKAYNDKKSELEKTKGDSTIGVVKRNKAANELDQLMAEDPLPLRKAKINQAATVKKSDKAKAAADEAQAKAEGDAKKAEEAEMAVEMAVKEAENKFKEALDFLEAEKRRGGVAAGDIWWMQREIQEKRKYLPASKQK